MSIDYCCPNCSNPLPSAAQNCTACGALFAEGTSWKPLPKPSENIEVVNQPVTAWDLIFAASGIALLVETFVRGTPLQQAVATSPMFVAFAKLLLPEVVLLLLLCLTYVPLSLLIWLLFRYFKVMDRVPFKYRGRKMFALGVALVLFFFAERVVFIDIFPASRSHIGYKLAAYAMVTGFVLLFVAFIRLCVGYVKGR